MRIETLGLGLRGVNRRRDKGGADKRDLFVLDNGYIDKTGLVRSRPGLSSPPDSSGTSRAALSFPAGTKGYIGWQGKHHTFHATSSTSGDSRLIVNVLRHPTGGAAALSRIHYAAPFLGRLYVVAEFTDGVVRHYWLDNPPAWQALFVYNLGDVIQPVPPNGYYYEVTNASTIISWQPNVIKVDDDRVQPIAANGFAYQCQASGPGPVKTSNTEPIWPTVIGEHVFERRFLDEADNPAPPEVVPEPPDPPEGGSGGNAYKPFPPRGRNPPTQEE